jgi:hypothetical protein
MRCIAHRGGIGRKARHLRIAEDKGTSVLGFDTREAAIVRLSFPARAEPRKNGAAELRPGDAMTIGCPLPAVGGVARSDGPIAM